MAAPCRKPEPPPEVEDPAERTRRDVLLLERLLGMLHAPLCAPLDHDGRPDDDVTSAYNLMVIDVCHAASRVAATIGF